MNPPLRRRLPVLPALAALLLTPPARLAAGEEAWVRARAPHFEVLSDAAGDRVRALAASLEQFRRVIAAILPADAMAAVDEVPTVVMAFRDQPSFAPFRPLYKGRALDVEGYFQAGSYRDYVAVSLGGTDEDAFETAYHEYAHVALNRALSAQPLWLSEGLAEVLSRWTAAPGEARVGLPAPAHLRRLQREKPLSVARLLRLDYTSPVYNEGPERALFYSQSWALAHWVLLGRAGGGAGDLRAYLAAIAAGAEPEGAFASAFGAEPAAVDRLLTEYVAGPLPAARFEVPELAGDIVVRSDTPSAAEIDYRLGDLLLHGGRVADARRRLQRATEADPAFAPAHEALGHAALRQGHWEEARREIRLALAADPADAAALLRYAEMLARETSARGEVLSDEREAEVVAALERALALAPHLADACEMLARLRPEPYDVRIAQVRAALARNPGRTSLRLVLAGLFAKKDDVKAARAELMRTRTLARDDAERFLADHLLDRLDRALAGTTEVSGRLVALDCRGEGVLRFLVEGTGGGRGPLRLETAPTGVFLFGRDGTPLQETLTCGPQGVAVTARYRPSPGGRPGAADGTLLSLTFQGR